MASKMDMEALNIALRERLGPDVWAKGMLAAVSQDAPDDFIREELAKASPGELRALAREMKHQSDLIEVFTNLKPVKVNVRGTRLIFRVQK